MSHCAPKSAGVPVYEGSPDDLFRTLRHGAFRPPLPFKSVPNEECEDSHLRTTMHKRWFVNAGQPDCVNLLLE
jgi:hypothetical protein